MNLRRLRYFTTLAEELHFGRAAARLHLAQPALTQNVQKLEADFGVELFARSSRRVELTEAGRLLFDEAQRLLAQATALEARMHAFARGGAGQLRINYARSATDGRSRAIVEALRETAPGVQLDINSQYTSKSIEDLLGGRLDAAFVRSPLELDEEGIARLRTLPVDSEPLVVALRRDHPLAARRRIPPPLLVDEPLVTGSSSRAPGFFRAMFGQIWTEAPPRIVTTEPDEDHMLRAVAAGQGICVLTHSRARLMQVPGVVIRSFTVPEPQAELALAWVEGNDNPALKTLLTIASRDVAD